MNSKRKGNIGEAIVIAKFVENNIPVYIPFGDNEKEDLIVKINNNFVKIQVKSCFSENENFADFRTISSRGIKSKPVPYTKEDVDYFALYHHKTKEIFLVAFSQARSGVTRIRFSKNKNNQIKNSNFKEDFLFDEVLKKLVGNA